MSSSTPRAISTKNSTVSTGSDAVWAFAELGNADTTTNLNNLTAVDVPFDGAFVQNGSGWAINGNGIQYNGPNTFIRVSWSVFTFSSSNRTNLLLQTAIDGTPIGPIASSGYVRNANGHQNSSYSMSGVWLPLTTGQTITVQAIREANAGTVTLGSVNTSILLLERIENV